MHYDVITFKDANTAVNGYPYPVNFDTDSHDLHELIDISFLLKFISHTSWPHSSEILEVYGFLPEGFPNPNFVYSLGDFFICFWEHPLTSFPRSWAEKIAADWTEDPCYDLVEIASHFSGYMEHRYFFKEYQEQANEAFSAKGKKEELIDDYASSMTLLDYFAAKMMVKIFPDADDATSAHVCYDIAEAMMKERQARYFKK